VRNYRVLRRVAREFLAGRAAEELVFGAEEAGFGAHSDLLKVTTLARQAFACRGGAPDIEALGRSGSNLAVLDDDPEQWSAQARERIDAMVREFMRLEYDETLRILDQHRTLLDLLTERLLRDNVIAREGFLEEAARAGYAVRARGRPLGGRLSDINCT
jgi:ATP-dependent Zn protease